MLIFFQCIAFLFLNYERIIKKLQIY